MSARKNITVTRNYQAEADACYSAIELLLKTTASKKGGVRAAPDDAERSPSAFDATRKCNP